MNGRRCATLLGTAVALGLLAGLISIPPATAATPIVGACYTLTAVDFTAKSSAVPPVDCAGPHTTETFLVSTWTEASDPFTMTDDQVNAVGGKSCPASAMFAYLQFRPPKQPIDRLRLGGFVPTPQEWAAGDRSIRCQVSMQIGADTLQPFSGTLAAKIASEGVLGWAYCTRAVKKFEVLKSNFLPGVCRDNGNNFIIITTYTMTEASYPGVKATRSRTLKLCHALAVKNVNSTVGPKSVVWTLYSFPLSKSWAQGFRTVTCGMQISQSRWA